MTIDRRQLALGLSLGALTFLPPAAGWAQDDEVKESPADLANTVLLDTKYGRVTILLRPDLAPKTVQQIKTLVRRGFYDGLKFHRVIAGFMAQTGDPLGNGEGGSDLPNVPAEFSSEPFKRGSVGMARTSDPNSGNSQFFICTGDAPFLDGKYTLFGQVLAGMDIVDQIKQGSEADNGMVKDPDTIIRMRMIGHP